MAKVEIYTILLCLIVFVALTALFTTLLACVVRLTVRLIRHGAEDERLLKEYEKQQKATKRLGVADVVAKIFVASVCVLLSCAFLFSVGLMLNEHDFSSRYSSLKVVKSDSMASKYSESKHLFEHHLNDQIQTFDLIVTEKLPDEFDLQLYDIVVYEYRGELIVHRIVGIEEPNANHPNERYFSLQGDAVEYKDKFPVLYSQMRAIYRGQRIPFIGSFVSFMQSPAGWLCILLIIFAIIATPLVEKKLLREKEKRLAIILRYGCARQKEASCIPLSHIRVNLHVGKEKRAWVHLASSQRLSMKLMHKGIRRK